MQHKPPPKPSSGEAQTIPSRDKIKGKHRPEKTGGKYGDTRAHNLARILMERR